MKLSLVDIAVAAFVGYGIWRGAKRGLSRELPRLAGTALAFFTGMGLLRWTDSLISKAGRWTGALTGITGFFGVLIAAYFITRQLKEQIRIRIAKRFPDEKLQRKWGMIAGGTRAFLLAATVILALNLLPFGFLTENSTLAWLLNKLVLPLYKTTHGSPENGRRLSEHPVL